jgi:lipoate-protein ligase B
MSRYSNHVVIPVGLFQNNNCCIRDSAYGIPLDASIQTDSCCEHPPKKTHGKLRPIETTIFTLTNALPLLRQATLMKLCVGFCTGLRVRSIADNATISGMNSVARENKAHALSPVDCGLADYRQVLTLQEQMRDQRRDGAIGDTVLIVEHPAVITLGARKSANKLLVSPEELAGRGIDLVEIRRGGGATAHNPGQLVFYPILHLHELGFGVNEYVRTLEAIGIELLAGLGVESDRRKGFPGLWVGPRKIASIGVRVSRCVTCHGMAINIQNDLSIFDLMVPCGLDGVTMTSVAKETDGTYDMRRIKQQLVLLLQRHFGDQP